MYQASAHIGPTKYQCLVTWRNGQILTDEPPELGGTDSGPDPMSLLLASLASCTLITLRMYIDQKQWDIPELSIDIILQQNKENGLESTFLRTIHVPDSVTEEQKKRIESIAHKCPVSKLLAADIRLEVTVP